MKRIILTILGAAVAPAMFAAELSVFRVCEDKRVLRTSDGADAGHVEYIVFEPSTQRVVSTIVTGGVVGPKFVAVPFTAMEFTNDREIALTQITRERIVSAPVIERTQITSRNVIEPTFIERTNNHFNVQANVNAQTDVQRRDRTTTETAPGRPARDAAASPGTQPGEKMPTDAPATSQRQKRAADSGSRQPGQNPPPIAEKVPGEKQPPATPEPQGRRPGQRGGERATEPQEGQRRDREGRAPEQSKQPLDRANEKAREQAERPQDQAQSLKEQAERKSGASEQPQQKPAEPDKKKKPATEEPR